MNAEKKPYVEVDKGFVIKLDDIVDVGLLEEALDKVDDAELKFLIELRLKILNAERILKK